MHCFMLERFIELTTGFDRVFFDGFHVTRLTQFSVHQFAGKISTRQPQRRRLIFHHGEAAPARCPSSGASSVWGQCRCRWGEAMKTINQTGKEKIL